MPGVRCTRSLACKMKKHTSRVTTVTPVSPGIPRADGFNGFLRALLGEPGLFATVINGLLRQLDASVGASGPHDFAVRFRAFVMPRQSVHRIPHPTSVTIAKRPFFGTGWREIST